MTDETAAPTPADTDEAPAPKKKFRKPGTGRYPVQLVVMESHEVADLIEELAVREHLHKTEIIRTFIRAGIRKAGHRGVLQHDDKRDLKLDEIGPEGK
jgi:hypothetical protein